jgi:hypothetical protein
MNGNAAILAAFRLACISKSDGDALRRQRALARFDRIAAPSVLNATASISSLGKPDLLRWAASVRHVFP